MVILLLQPKVRLPDIGVFLFRNFLTANLQTLPPSSEVKRSYSDMQPTAPNNAENVYSRWVG
jgi:hypothetical protein